jgi:hypothetical protein
MSHAVQAKAAESAESDAEAALALRIGGTRHRGRGRALRPAAFAAFQRFASTPQALTVHSNCATLFRMKTAQLPPVRVDLSVREEIESVLHQGETLSQFVVSAAVQAAQRRKSQQEFLARGRDSLKRAKKTGEYYSAKDALDAMQARLDAHISKLVPEKRVRAGRS